MERALDGCTRGPQRRYPGLPAGFLLGGNTVYRATRRRARRHRRLTLAAHTNRTKPVPARAVASTSFFVLWLALLGTAGDVPVARHDSRAQGKTLRIHHQFSSCSKLLCLVTVAEARLATDACAIGRRKHHRRFARHEFLLRTFAISSIIIALAMRYLYVSSEWRRSIVLEAQARISALQALIRPHFLFNSMNTIASLTRTDPRQAEEAVEDLSDLLRANLSSSGESLEPEAGTRSRRDLPAYREAAPRRATQHSPGTSRIFRCAHESRA